MNKYQSLYGRLFNYEIDYIGKDLVKLEGMDYDTSIFKIPKIFKYAIDLMFKHHTLTYSDFSGFERFKNLIKKYEDYRANLTNSKNFVYVGSGVSNLVYPVVESILSLDKNKSRKSILVFEPDYPLLVSVAERLGANIIGVKGKRENDYGVTLKDVEDLLDENVCAVIFSYPNNPTCTYQDKSFFEGLVNLSKDKDFFIVSDEIYRDTFYNQEDYTNIATINNGYENFVRLYGFSKDRPGMTGMRCGYIIGDPIIEDSILNNQLLRNFSGNIISEYLFMIDISLRYYNLSGVEFEDFKYYPKRLIKQYFRQCEKNKSLQKKYNKLVINRLKKNKNVIDIIEPRAGNSVLFKYFKYMLPEKFQEEMINKGIAVYSCDAFSLIEDDGVWGRVCVTKHPEYLYKGIDKI